jgi:hypothetical protein
MAAEETVIIGKEGSAFFIGKLAWWMGRNRTTFIAGTASNQRQYHAIKIVGPLFWIQWKEPK